MLNLERLRVLRAVATTGSVVGAARTLHVTTSAVSQQLGRLEREAGITLVERHGRGIRLTPAGAALAASAAELLAHAERVEAGLAAQRGTVSGPLTIAAFATAARGLLPGALRTLADAHPELTASLTELEPHEAIPALRRGDADLAVVQDWATDPLTVPDDLSRAALCDDVFDLALPVGHPRAGDAGPIPAAALADEDWIGWSSGQICHDWLVRTLGRPVRHTASEHSTQLALVEAGLGVALVPRLGRGPVPDGVRLVPVSPAPARRVFVLWRTTTSQRPAVWAALDALTESVPPDRAA
ncbi:LysR family transcriptional regulator [Catenuloplanes japonicus]|uniref:LysR family transcriptional regulator n=1 Tax=Catenuloplanes japonicus TaxID=33876 RepID=UPI0005277D8A|nr:LysR family transcriptional regulator [Catenuloplanes japonicus]